MKLVIASMQRVVDLFLLKTGDLNKWPILETITCNARDVIWRTV